MKKIYAVLFLSLFLFPVLLQAQVNSSGKEFYLSLGITPGTATFAITSKHNATVTFYFPDDPSYTETHTITPNVVSFIPLTYPVATNFIADAIAIPQQKSVHLVSDSNIVVIFGGLAGVDEDAMLLYPSSCQQQRDTVDFYTIGAGTVITTNGFAIVSQCDGLPITITPVASTGVYTAGVPFDISLDAGETFWLANEGNADQSGSLIRTIGAPCNNPFSVYTTYAGGYVGLPWSGSPCCSDKMMEQDLPVPWWDTLYHFVPFYGDFSDAVLRFVSSANGNPIYFDGTLVHTLAQGGIWDTVLASPTIIKSAKPIGISQFMQSWDIGIGNPTDGDPAQLWLNPLAMGIRESIFKSFPLVVPDTNTLSTVTLITDVTTTGVLLNGTDITPGFVPFPGDPQYVYQQVELDESLTYHLESGNRVIAYYTTAYHQGSLVYSLGDLKLTPYLVRDTLPGPIDTLYRCGAVSLTLTATPADGYLWSTGATQNSIQVTAKGIYTVYEGLYLEECLKDVRRHSFVVLDGYGINLGNDTVICDDAPLTLQPDITGDSYRWQDGSTKKNYTATTSGQYWVEINQNNCLSTDTINVTFAHLNPYPGEDIPVCRGTLIDINLSAALIPGATALWSTGATGETIRITDTGMYIVTVSYPPCRATDSVRVFAEMCSCNTMVPSAFSPNKDGLNDIFLPVLENNCPVAEYSFSIFNRWGQRIFHSVTIDKGWDGTFRGTPCDLDTYFYEVNMKVGTLRIPKSFKGDVTLLR